MSMLWREKENCLISTLWLLFSRRKYIYLRYMTATGLFDSQSDNDIPSRNLLTYLRPHIHLTTLAAVQEYKEHNWCVLVCSWLIDWPVCQATRECRSIVKMYAWKANIQKHKSRLLESTEEKERRFHQAANDGNLYELGELSKKRSFLPILSSPNLHQWYVSFPHTNVTLQYDTIRFGRVVTGKWGHWCQLSWGPCWLDRSAHSCE